VPSYLFCNQLCLLSLLRIEETGVELQTLLEEEKLSGRFLPLSQPSHSPALQCYCSSSRTNHPASQHAVILFLSLSHGCRRCTAAHIGQQARSCTRHVIPSPRRCRQFISAQHLHTFLERCCQAFASASHRCFSVVSPPPLIAVAAGRLRSFQRRSCCP
jgi:hypothetical protein